MIDVPPHGPRQHDPPLLHPTWPPEHHERVATFRADLASDPRLLPTLIDWSTSVAIATTTSS